MRSTAGDATTGVEMASKSKRLLELEGNTVLEPAATEVTSLAGRAGSVRRLRFPRWAIHHVRFSNVQNLQVTSLLHVGSLAMLGRLAVEVARAFRWLSPRRWPRFT